MKNITQVLENIEKRAVQQEQAAARVEHEKVTKAAKAAKDKEAREAKVAKASTVKNVKPKKHNHPSSTDLSSPLRGSKRRPFPEVTEIDDEHELFSPLPEALPSPAKIAKGRKSSNCVVEKASLDSVPWVADSNSPMIEAHDRVRVEAVPPKTVQPDHHGTQHDFIPAPPGYHYAQFGGYPAPPGYHCVPLPANYPSTGINLSEYLSSRH